MNNNASIIVSHIAPRSLAWLALAGLLVLPQAARAADIIKANNANNLNVGTAWIGGSAPGTADIAVWNSTVSTAANATNAPGGDVTWGGIKILNPIAPGRINEGSNPIKTYKFGSGGINMDEADSTQNFFLGPEIDLIADSAIRIKSGLTLRFNRTFDINNCTVTLNFAGTLEGAGSGSSVFRVAADSVSSTGVVNHTAGLAWFKRTGTTQPGFNIGNAAGNVGIYNQSGTAVVDTDDLSGTIVRMGDNATALGIWNLSGNAVAYATTIDVGNNGTAVINLSENAQLQVNTLLNLGRAGTANGTFNLNGGTATVMRVSRMGIGTGAGVFNFNGGVLMPMASAGDFMTSLNAVNVGDGGAIIDTAGFDVTVAQALLAGGTGGLTKRGDGALTIDSTNTYTGPTLVAGGKLVLGSGHAGGGAITVQDGAMLDLKVQKGKSLAVAGLSLGNSTLNLLLGASGNATVPVIAATNLSATGTVALNVSGVGFAVGQFTLIKYSGAIGGLGYAAFQLGPMPAGVVANLVDNQANQSIDLNITVAPILYWLGVTEDWDVLNTQNWHLDPADFVNLVQYSDGSTVRFDDSGLATSIRLVNNVYPGGVTVSNNLLAYTFSTLDGAAIMGGGQLVKQGSNAVTMSLNNTYAGDTVINSGTFNLGISGALPDGSGAGNVTVDGTLNLAGFSETINGLSGTGRVDNASANPATLTLGGNNAAGSFSGTIENSGGGALTLAKTGNNTFYIGGSNSFAGGTVLSAGRIELAHDAALGTGYLELRAGALASAGGVRAVTNAVNITGGAPAFDTAGGDLYLLGPLTDLGAFDPSKTGDASLVLKGGQYFGSTGGWNIYRGLLVVDGCIATNVDDGMRISAPSEGVAGLMITNGGSYVFGTVSGSPNLRLGNTANLTGSNYLLIASGEVVMELTGREIIAGDAASTTGLVNQAGGVVRWTNNNSTGIGVFLGNSAGSHGVYNLDGGTLLTPRVRRGSGVGYFNFNGGTLSPASTVYAATFMQGLTAAVVKDGGAVIDSAGLDLTIAQSLLAGGTGGLTKNGAGTLALTGTNTYTGPTIANAGRLKMNTLHSGGGALQVAGGATLEVDVAGTSATLVAGALTADNGAALTLNLRGSLNQTAPILQVGNLALGETLTINIGGTELAPGLYPLIQYTGARSGTLVIEMGTLPKGVVAGLSDSQLPNNGTISLLVLEVEQLTWAGRDSAAWDINSSFNWLLAGNFEPYLDGSNVRFDDSALQFPDVLLAQPVTPAGIVVSNLVFNYSFSGTGKITGSGSLLKQGPGSLLLSTSNDFSGPVRVEGGLLIASNATALGSSVGATYVTNGATLDVQNFNLNGEPIFIAGAGVGGGGALVNSTTNQQQNSIQQLTLTANATVGGNGRFDLRGTTNTALVSTLGQPFSLTKVGSNHFAIVGATVDPVLGDLNVLGGTLSFETSATSFGDPARNLIIASNATFMMYRCDQPMNKQVVIQGGGRFYSHSGVSWTNYLLGPVTLTDGWGRFDANYPLIVTNVISGAGGLEKVGANRLSLHQANTFAGGSLITAGIVELGSDLSLSTGPISLGAATLTSDSAAPRTLTNALTLTGAAIFGDLVNTGAFTLTGPVDFNAAARNVTFNTDVLMTGVSTNGGMGQKSGAGTLTLRDVAADWISTFQVFNGTVIIDHSTLVKTTGTVRVRSSIAGGLARLVITNGSVVTVAASGTNLRIGYDGNATATNIVDLAGTYTSISSAYFGYASGQSAEDILNLLPDGVLEIRAVRDDGGSRSVFNFLGGTLRASTNLDAGIFMQGLAEANVGNAGAFIDTAGFDLTVGQPLLAAGTGGLTKLGAGVLTLTGVSTYTGPTLVSAGTLAVRSSQAAPGAVTVADGAGFKVAVDAGATLSVSGLVLSNSSLAFDLGAAANPAQAAAIAPALTAQGTVLVSVQGGGFQAGQRFTLVDYSGAIGGLGGTAFQLAGQPVGVLGYLTNNTQAGALEYVVTAAARPLAWAGVAGDAWEIGGAANWTNLNTLTLDTYQQNLGLGDFVRFDDNAASFNVDITTTLLPTSIAVSNSVDYRLGGAGQLGGAGVLTKDGLGALTLSSANAYAGGTILNAGALRLGNDLALGVGPLTINGGELTSDGAAARTLTNAVKITGSNTLGSAAFSGPVTLAGLVDFNGALQHLNIQGAVTFGGGSTNGRLHKYGPGALTLHGSFDWGVGDVDIRDGALIMDGAAVTLDGGLRPNANVPGGLARLVLTNGAVLTYTDTNNNLRVGYNSDTTATNIADIAGTVRFTSTNLVGGGRLLFSGGGTIGILNLLSGGVAEVFSVGKDGTAGYAEINLDGGVLRAISNHTGFLQGLNAAYVRDGGAILDTAGFDITVGQYLLAGGAGGLTKLGAGVLSLTGQNTYTGATIISNGVLKLEGIGNISTSTNILIRAGADFDVSARLGFALAAGQMLSGDGRVIGDLAANGAVSPGEGIGTLAFLNNLSLAGQTVMQIHKTGGLVTSDRLVVSNALVLSGTLTVQLSGDALAAGDVVDLFDAASVVGAFTLDLPALPNGLAWDTSSLAAQGRLAVVSAGLPLAISQPQLAAGSIVLAITGGTPGNQCYLVASTNVAAAASLWLPVATNTFDAGGQTVFTNAVNPSWKDRYFRVRLTP